MHDRNLNLVYNRNQHATQNKHMLMHTIIAASNLYLLTCERDSYATVNNVSHTRISGGGVRSRVETGE